MNRVDVDLVIVGGGLAGLSLASRLAAQNFDGSVLLVEPRLEYTDDRSWCLFTPEQSPWAVAATRRWQRWRIAARADAGLELSAAGWCYAYLRSSAVYAAALAKIAETPRIQLLRGHRVDSIRALDPGVEISSSAGTVRARWAVDTRPPSIQRIAQATLRQSFAGREIVLSGSFVDDGVVELMTDMHTDAHGFVFTYVLPLSPERALVEATRFSTTTLDPGVLEADLDAVLEARGWASAQVLRRESATLPMGLPVVDTVKASPAVVCAGIGAGALRAASGYGFARIQAWADRCAQALARGAAPCGHPREPRLQAWMDTTFLRVLAAEPERTPAFFTALARALPGTVFARFMADAARPADLARIVAALPPAPFLRALMHSRPRPSAAVTM